jgi:thymidylate synthase
MKYRHKDGTPFTKEEFLEKLRTDKEFNDEFGNKGIDQISDLIKQLKEIPDSRRMLVSAWNPSDLPHQVLPPCHYSFQVYTRELSLEERTTLFENSKHSEHDNLVKFKDIGELDKVIPKRAISLMWNQRSCDLFLGIPFNIASYGLLLEIIAKEVNMVPDELIGNLGDVHLYSNHIEQAKEQIGRELTLNERKQIFEDRGCVCDVWPFNGDWNGEYDGFGIPTRTRQPYPLPTLRIEGNEPSIIEKTVYWKPEDFRIENYQSHPTIKAPLSN